MIEHCIKYIPLNELRVGNKIYGADPTTVITVSVDTLILLERHPNLSMPIPITPDILIACGFEKYYDPQKDHRREWWSIEHFTLEVYDAKVEFVSLTSNQRVFVQSLHQLQNLYFALTGKELEYNPK